MAEACREYLVNPPQCSLHSCRGHICLAKCAIRSIHREIPLSVSQEIKALGEWGGRERENTVRKISRGVIRTSTAFPFQAAGLAIPPRIRSGKGQKALLIVAILLFWCDNKMDHSRFRCSKQTKYFHLRLYMGSKQRRLAGTRKTPLYLVENNTFATAEVSCHCL